MKKLECELKNDGKMRALAGVCGDFAGSNQGLDYIQIRPALVVGAAAVG